MTDFPATLHREADLIDTCARTDGALLLATSSSLEGLYAVRALNGERP
ncbi:hypothetical protein L3067_17120 [Xanthomonas sp. PPL568]|nr:hypothetical protein [Xanthomonas indica]MCI2246331.1 hypothetical protein [Xanthomonas indica]